MARSRRLSSPHAIGAAVILCVIGALVAIADGRSPSRPSLPQPETAPAVEVVFDRPSYAPGDRGVLVFWSDRSEELTMQIFRADRRLFRDDEMRGTPVTDARRVRPRRARITLRVGDWKSGLYYARVARSGRFGYAPFVLRSRPLGRHRVAVVLPTYTWQAYNFRDVDRDGVGDTWYASPDVHVVDLKRPYLNRGVPPKFRGYDAGFLAWLRREGHRADFLADEDLETMRGERLARLYDLIVFSGHEEYVTRHVFDQVERYRDLGGNLAFLSANNFFYRVERRGRTLLGRTRWRDVGRHESRLIGVEYVDWHQERYENKPYVVTGTHRAPWLFRATGLVNGSRFGTYGIEIDARTRHSPPGTVVVARIPNIFGPGKTAEMTYYRTRNGAQVFAAGTLNFGGSALFPAPGAMLANLWEHLSRP